MEFPFDDEERRSKMPSSKIIVLSLLLAGVSGMPGAVAQAQCQIVGFPAEWGISSRGEFVIGSGGSCQISIPISGQIQAANVVQSPIHGRIEQIDLSNYVYVSETGFRGRDSFALSVTGSGPSSAGTSTITLAAEVQ